MSAQESFILFHNGKPNTKTAMLNSNILDYDDYIEINMRAKFEDKVTNSKSKEIIDRLNAFILEISPKLGQEILSNKDKDTVFLDGLVITLLGHNDTSQAEGSKTYYLTYRFLPKMTQLTKDYLSHLFERRDKHEGCYIDIDQDLTDFKITIDFERSDMLFLQHKKAGDAEWNECFSVSNISKYVTKTQSFIRLQQFTGRAFTLRTQIHSLNVLEKHHRLDVESSLHVSHDLVEEIFDKVKNFGKIFEEDKENLATVQDLQTSLLEQAQLLEIYSRDLNRGSRKFQEYMIESLNKHRLINPLSMPKMLKIKAKIDDLESKQNKIFERFVNIKGFLNAKNVVKETYKNFKKIDKIIELTTKEISSDEFKSFVTKTKNLMKVLKRVDFAGFIEQIKKAAQKNESEVAATSNRGMYVIIGICLGVLIFSCVIIRSIGKAEKAHMG